MYIDKVYRDGIQCWPLNWDIELQTSMPTDCSGRQPIYAIYSLAVTISGLLVVENLRSGRITTSSQAYAALYEKVNCSSQAAK